MTLRPLARLYIATIVALAVVLTLLGLRALPDLSASRLLLAAGFAALLGVSNHFQLDFSYRQKLSLDTAVILAVALLFLPGPAMAIVAVGAALAQLWNRAPWYEWIFNGAQNMLQAGAASGILLLAGWSYDPLRFDDPLQIVLLPVVVGAVFVINTVTVSLIVALQTGLAFLAVWRQTAFQTSLEDLAQIVLGLLAATVVDAHAWALPLFLVPAVAIYLSLERHVRLRQQTVDAVEALADLVDLRDRYTANHSRRVAIYARELATELAISPAEVDLIERAARVHDVGKLIIDQTVLAKSDRLSDREWAQLKQHPITGVQVLSRFPEFALATSYVRHHHESIDGTGYPDGIAGDAIPFGARIIAVADSFDAMASARPYRKALPPEIVLAEFHERRGTQWDSQVVDALFTLVDQERIVFSSTASTPQLLDRHGVAVPLPSAV